ncbi:Disease resistance protein RPS5, putative isoform 3 [Hibiscus syriacus]|uniref:Disease resistance protein RPS5, putative isoform 3 n=1 Tax=Hibiscus syriacus TaxID=106335 RepID=A0A6A2ZVR8_HIBSY|nr:Disease resistance protein RPS5, putative isoform 3 [Hibiscus syriacus]
MENTVGLDAVVETTWGHREDGNVGIIGRLSTLQYLNLSLTGIKELPSDLANLRNLKCLLLDYTLYLKEIPPEELSCLSLLQVYSKINGVSENFDEPKVSAEDELDFLEVLEEFEHLDKLCITLFTYSSIQKIFTSRTLRTRIRKLTMMDCRGLVSLRPESSLPNLGRLEIFRCCSLKEFRMQNRGSFCSLRQVHVGVCLLLPNLNCLAYARNLETLTILDCESMKHVISEEGMGEDEVLPKLKTISLTRLRSLETICRWPMFFSSLLKIDVSQCPRLRQLPFEGETAHFLKKIRGETE